MSKKVVIVVIVLIFLLSGSIKLCANDYQQLESYIGYRIKYIRNVAYNSKVTLPTSRAREYAQDIVYWSNYYSRKFDIKIDPLLITAILETETNFVSRSDYDNGASIGIGSMRIDTAKWIADHLNIRYSKWRVLNATDLGIRFTTYYLGLAYQEYNGDLNKVIIAYNQGFTNAHSKNLDKLYNNYLFKVLGRYNYYQQRVNSYNDLNSNHYSYKLAQLS